MAPGLGALRIVGDGLAEIGQGAVAIALGLAGQATIQPGLDILGVQAEGLAVVSQGLVGLAPFRIGASRGRNTICCCRGCSRMACE